MRTDKYIVARQLDLDTAENYRSELTNDDLRLAQALQNAAAFYLPSLRSEANKFLTMKDSVPWALFGVLLWSLAIWHWIALEILGSIMLGVAVLVFFLTRTKSRMRVMIDLFEAPFLDLGDILKKVR